MDNIGVQIDYGANHVKPIVCPNNSEGKTKNDINIKGRHGILRETRILVFLFFFYWEPKYTNIFFFFSKNSKKVNK